jgi:hypothetical protein
MKGAKRYFVYLLFPSSIVFYSFTFKQLTDNHIINKKLIFGKWVYINSFEGRVTMIFKEDGTGYRYTDSSRVEQKFKYQTTDHSLLKFYVGSYKPEIYRIDTLTSQILSIREHPMIKIKESISIYESTFKRSTNNRSSEFIQKSF